VWKRRLGKNWKKLHSLIYYIAPLAVLHYAWGKKGTFFALQGDILKPLIYAIVLILLMLFRVPALRRWIAMQWGRLRGAWYRRLATG
jgi:sulfoxide reductase heme-binding subunit YedZ